MIMGRLRKGRVLLSLGFVVSLGFLVMLVADGVHREQEQVVQSDDLDQLEQVLTRLETDIRQNRLTIDTLQDWIKGVKREQKKNEKKNSVIKQELANVEHSMASVSSEDALLAESLVAQCDISMNRVYEELSFDNVDGGAWKQGWDVQYDADSANKKENMLKVFVMPHSHNDPGWIKTFEAYYSSQTRTILTSMIDAMEGDERRRFVWAEISYLSLWWNEQNEEMRNRFRALLKKGQIEIVTGGWVMSDEANTNLFAMIEDLVSGHEWLRINMDGYQPNNGWAIDPFGHSPTKTFLLKRSGFDAMLIQRTHYSVKKHLASNQDLEFMWRQQWDKDKTSDMLTHMMPFYSYDVPHTCGPDPKICCQFDFDRLREGPFSCPWGIQPKAITHQNVRERAHLLIDQYRKKSTLYKSNVVLAPLGDDFRYAGAAYWQRQLTNYEKIMEYVNNHLDEFNAEMHWGNLEEYFTALREESKRISQSETGLFKSLMGDFFTYADRDDHYWSGYYTSRPFHKNLDRILSDHLRSAEILFSLSWAEMGSTGRDVRLMAETQMDALVQARHALALFQHHDGITGTAKDHVVNDYGEKMHRSINGLHRAMGLSAQYLLAPNKHQFKLAGLENILELDLDEHRASHESLARKSTLKIDKSGLSSTVIVFNSHARARKQMISIIVDHHAVRVFVLRKRDDEEVQEDLSIQISPVFEDQTHSMSSSQFELSFVAEVEALSLQTFYIQLMPIDTEFVSDKSFPTIKLMNAPATNKLYRLAPFEDVQIGLGTDFELSNAYNTYYFGNNGLLKAIKDGENRVRKSELKFVKYGTRRSGDKSGAYLFLPDGPAVALEVDSPVVRVVEGQLLSRIEVFTQFAKHVVTLVKSGGVESASLHILNLVDVRRMNNQELVMRVDSDLDSSDRFVTDLNAFQNIERTRNLRKLPIQANFYPVPSMIYIEDELHRLTFVTRQPLGGSSLKSGQVEIVQDRRLMQDDNRGVGQGVKDNRVTPNEFVLLLETRTNKECVNDPSLPSLLALESRRNLVYPMKRMLVHKPSRTLSMLKKYVPIQHDLACDIELINLRTSQIASGPGDETALIVNRQGFSACFKPIAMTCATNGGKLSMEALFPNLFGNEVRQMSLSMMYEGSNLEKSFVVSLNPMELYSFVLRR